MTSELSTEDLRTELEKRESRKARALKGAGRQATGVSALIIALLGGYEAYTNREVTKTTAKIAAEAKVDVSSDRAALIEEINRLKLQEALLKAELDRQSELGKERYDHLREWLRVLSRRKRVAVADKEIEEPDPPAVWVKKVPTERQKPEDYQEQVQQVLKEKGLK